MTTFDDPGARSRHGVTAVRGSELHYWTYAGKDGAQTRPIVMVHGLRGTHHGLEPIAAHLPGREAVIPDLPGFGDSTPMDQVHDVAGYAEAMERLLEELGAAERPVDLLGHSFGSIVAARLAARRPELVHRLVLVNPIATPALDGARVVLSRLTALYYRLGRALPERAGRALMSNRWIVLGASAAMVRTRDPRVRRFVHDSHLRFFSRFHSTAVLSEAFDASVNATVLDYADSLGVPTLLVAGASDEIAPVAGQHGLAARLSDARLVVIPEVGHLVHYETPSQAAEEINMFLAAPASPVDAS